MTPSHYRSDQTHFFLTVKPEDDYSPFYAIIQGQMSIAQAEKQELMLALYIFMTFGVFTEYRSYCLEDFHDSQC